MTVLRRTMKMGLLPCILALLATSCAPSTRISIGVRERPVNVRLGDYGATPPPAPTIDVPITGGFITPPVRLDRPPSLSSPPPLLACPHAPPGTPAEAAAPTTVTKAPREGNYRFSRQGRVRSGDPDDPPDSLASRPWQPLSTVLLQQLTNVQETKLPSPDDPTTTVSRITFDVIQTEPGLRTTTSYLIDPVGSGSDRRTSAGLKITKIVLERTDLPGDLPGGAGNTRGIETFSPQPSVKIMNLPAQGEPPPGDSTFASQGTDPQSGASMEVFSATQTRVNIDICGRVIQAWRVRVSFPETPGGPFNSGYDRPQVRNYEFAGDFVFAPQFALIVQQTFTFRGLEIGNTPFEMTSAATIDSLVPA